MTSLLSLVMASTKLLKKKFLRKILTTMTQMEDIPEDELNSLYYLVGYCITQLVKNDKHCQKCLPTVNGIDPLSFLHGLQTSRNTRMYVWHISLRVFSNFSFQQRFSDTAVQFR